MSAFREVTWDWATTPNPAFPVLIPLGHDRAFRRAAIARLQDATQFPDVLGIIFFENLDVTSSQAGASSILPYGPSNTVKGVEGGLLRVDRVGPGNVGTVEVLVDPALYWLNDLPSQRQYPTWYISRERHLAAGAVDDETATRHCVDVVPWAPPVKASIEQVADKKLAKRLAKSTILKDVTNPRPCILTLDRLSWPAVEYTRTNGGQPEAVIMAIGNPPSRKGYYVRENDDQEWYLGGTYAGPVKRPYHPFGPNFMLLRWTHNDRIDAGEKKIKPRFQLLLRYLD